MAASSSEDSSETKPESPTSVIGGLLSDLNLDHCAQDYSKYIKVDASSEVAIAPKNLISDDGSDDFYVRISVCILRINAK